MKLSDYVFEFLEKKGVDTVFYLPGGGCMHLVDSLASSRAINAVSLLHEQAVAVAAESFANTRGTPGAVLATTGPGATNTITGMLAAYLDSTPVIFITGQVKTTDLKSNFGVRSHGSQEADISAIAGSFTKYSVMITDKNSIRGHLERAWHEAVSGRPGPVLLDIPLDIQGAQIDPASLAGFSPEEIKNDADITPIIEALSRAERPVFIAGNGLARCKKEFAELCRKLSVPLIPSWKAMDYISNDDDLYAGRSGGMGDRHGNLTMQNADLIISFACRLDFSITGFDRTAWAPNAKKIVIDIDTAEINKLRNAGDIVPIVADVATVVKKLLLENNKIKTKNLDGWKRRISEWKEKYPVLPRDVPKNAPLSTSLFINELCRILPNDAHIAPCSSGTTAEIFFQNWTVRNGQTIRSNHGLGSMGFEIPNAIGMCVASGNKDTCCIAGDGGMQLNIQELAVLRGRNLPVKLFVINNSGYASIRNMQNNHFNGRHAGCDGASGLYLPDMKKLAAAYEIPYFRADSYAGCAGVIRDVMNKPGPVLCEVVVDKECFVSPRAVSQVCADGTMRSSSLENQYPFLSDEEMRSNMVVFT